MNGSMKVPGKPEAVSRGAQTPGPAGLQTGATADNAEQLHEAIAVAAYYFAEARNFEPGRELDDWLKAEAQVLAPAEELKRAA